MRLLLFISLFVITLCFARQTLIIYQTLHTRNVSSTPNLEIYGYNEYSYSITGPFYSGTSGHRYYQYEVDFMTADRIESLRWKAQENTSGFFGVESSDSMLLSWPYRNEEKINNLIRKSWKK